MVNGLVGKVKAAAPTAKKAMVIVGTAATVLVVGVAIKTIKDRQSDGEATFELPTPEEV